MTTQNTTRPTFLSILCILSFIGGSFSFLSNITIWLLSDKLKAYMMDVGWMKKINSSIIFKKLNDNSFDSVIDFMDQLSTVLLVNTTLAAISLGAVYLMWKLNSVGFLLYVGAQLFLLCAPYIFLGSGFISSFGLLWQGFFSMAFVILYAFNLKHLSY